MKKILSIAIIALWLSSSMAIANAGPKNVNSEDIISSSNFYSENVLFYDEKEFPFQNSNLLFNGSQNNDNFLALFVEYNVYWVNDLESVFIREITFINIGETYDLPGNPLDPLHGHLHLALVPEPETYLMILVGLGLVSFATIRKKNQGYITVNC